VFQSSSDAGAILQRLTRAGGVRLADQLARALTRVRGAYTLLLLTPESVIGVRDPSGFRPLTLGRLGDSWLLASETCALDLMEAQVGRDIEPGDIIVVDGRGGAPLRPRRLAPRPQCVCASVCFSAPASVLRV